MIASLPGARKLFLAAVLAATSPAAADRDPDQLRAIVYGLAHIALSSQCPLIQTDHGRADELYRELVRHVGLLDEEPYARAWKAGATDAERTIRNEGIDVYCAALERDYGRNGQRFPGLIIKVDR